MLAGAGFGVDALGWGLTWHRNIFTHCRSPPTCLLPRSLPLSSNLANFRLLSNQTNHLPLTLTLSIFFPCIVFPWATHLYRQSGGPSLPSDALPIQGISPDCCLSLSRTVVQQQSILGFHPHIEQTHRWTKLCSFLFWQLITRNPSHSHWGVLRQRDWSKSEDGTGIWPLLWQPTYASWSCLCPMPGD